jgi:hypothetical protein
VVPSGQGKARIMATAAAIAFISKLVTKVHFVFPDKHLMERDREEFKFYWLLLGKEEH